MSLIDQLKALDDQRTKLIEDAKHGALEKAHKAIAELNDLGFSYRLTESGRAAPAKSARPSKSAGGAKRQIKDAVCPICHFKTQPMHDGRSHRGQNPKRPFTAAELAQRHFSIV